MIIPLCKRFVALTGITLFVLLCCCTGPMQAGSETTGGVKIATTGTTIQVTTTPAAIAILFDARFNPGDTQKVADTATADDSGQIEFADLPAGMYNVFIYPQDPSQGAAVFGIPIAMEVLSYADSSTFASLRTIVGIITWQGQPDSTSQVNIVGSPFVTKTDTQGGFSFKNIPVGVYAVVARSFSRSTELVEDSVMVNFTRTGNSTVTVVLELK